VLARPGQDEALAAALGVDPAPGLASRTPAGTTLRLAPGAWMVVTEDLDDGELYRSLLDRLRDLAAVVDQSHGRAVLRLAGADGPKPAAIVLAPPRSTGAAGSACAIS
jgi:heterotetrameric sarcosine oxidase gamma subunit